MTNTSMIIDHTDNSVTVNGKVVAFGKYDYVRVAYEFANIETWKGDVAGLRKASDILGTSCANFAKMLNGAMFNGYIRKNAKMIHRLGYIKGNYDSMMVNAVNAGITGIEEYKRDGNNHLAAMALIVGNAQEAKKLLGKGLWSALCKNSMTRNDTIVANVLRAKQYVEDTGYGAADNTAPSWNDNVGCLVAILNKVPSTLFKKISSSTCTMLLKIFHATGMDDVLLKMAKATKKPLKDMPRDTVERMCRIIIDTHVMLDDVGEKFNKDWSTKRIIEEHNKVAKRIAARRFSGDRIKCLDKFPETINFIGATARLLTSGKAIQEHGSSQHNCVVSYIDRVIKGIYVLYEIVEVSPDRDGFQVAYTFGMDTNKKHCQYQMYGVCNSFVTNKDVITVAQFIQRLIFDTCVLPNADTLQDTATVRAQRQMYAANDAWLQADEEIPF